jgi:tRNA threonylcarbamoyladenosine biosynthesis protein TsaE
LLRPGAFVALQGGLGGGKTCLTRGLVAALAPESAHLVASPTFAIMNHYVGSIPVYHFDLYRLGGDADVADLGFDDYFHGDGVCVVEWSERLSELLPPDVVTVRLDYVDADVRRIRLSSNGDISAGVIGQLTELHRQKKL